MPKKDGKSGLEGSFLTASLFRAEVDHSRCKELGEVHVSDSDNHDGVVRTRSPIRLARRSLMTMTFAHPRESQRSLTSICEEAGRFRFRPAALHEARSIIQAMDRERIEELFRGVDIVRSWRGVRRPAQTVAIVCLESFVVSRDVGHLTPMIELDRYSPQKMLRLHLIRCQADSNLLPAQMMPLVAS